jgi:hypothetical protein
MLHAVGLPQKIRKKVIRHELYKSSRVRIVGGILASKRGETQLRNPEYNPTACNILHSARWQKDMCNTDLYTIVRLIYKLPTNPPLRNTQSSRQFSSLCGDAPASWLALLKISARWPKTIMSLTTLDLGLTQKAVTPPSETD